MAGRDDRQQGICVFFQTLGTALQGMGDIGVSAQAPSARYGKGCLGDGQPHGWAPGCGRWQQSPDAASALPATDDESPGLYGFLHVIVHSAKGFKQSASKCGCPPLLGGASASGGAGVQHVAPFCTQQSPGSQ